MAARPGVGLFPMPLAATQDITQHITCGSVVSCVLRLCTIPYGLRNAVLNSIGTVPPVPLPPRMTNLELKSCSRSEDQTDFYAAGKPTAHRESRGMGKATPHLLAISYIFLKDRGCLKRIVIMRSTSAQAVLLPHQLLLPSFEQTHPGVEAVRQAKEVRHEDSHR